MSRERGDVTRKLERASADLDHGAAAVARHLCFEEVHRRRADEAADERVCRIVVHLERIAELDDAALVHDRDAVAHAERFDLVVGDVDGRGVEALQQASSAPRASPVAAARRDSRAARPSAVRRPWSRSRARPPRAGVARPRAATSSGRESPRCVGARRTNARARRSPPSSPSACGGRRRCCRTPSCAGRPHSSGRPSRSVGAAVEDRWRRDPPMYTRPASTRSRPARQRRSVVFPQPDGPSRTTNSLSFTSRSTPSTAVKLPKVLRTPSNRMSATVQRPFPADFHVSVPPGPSS